VAHAFSTPVVDPELPADLARLSADLPIIKALAEEAMERKLGIISESAYRGAHLYELEGFARILGPHIVDCLKAGEPINETEAIRCPNLSLRLRDHPPFNSYENVTPIRACQEGKALVLHCHSEGNRLLSKLVLDFGDWRLRFEPSECASADDGSPQAMIAVSDTALFAKGKYGNGEIEVYEADTGLLLGRTDPYLPVNIDFAATDANLDRISREALEEADRRKKQKPDCLHE
jgi:hypothetical protein